MSVKTETSPFYDDEGLTVYPTNQLLCIFDKAAQVDEVLEALYTMGYTKNAIALITGEAGVEKIDVEANNFGLGGHIIRALQHMGGEHQAYQNYEAAMLRGDYVLAIPIEIEEERDRIVELYKAHQGHYINYFDNFSVNTL